jgi:hypothetical protein
MRHNPLKPQDNLSIIGPDFWQMLCQGTIPYPMRGAIPYDTFYLFDINIFAILRKSFSMKHNAKYLMVLNKCIYELYIYEFER